MRFRTALLGLGTGLVMVLSACGNGPPPESNSTSASGGGSGGGAEAIVQSGTAAKSVSQTDALKFDPNATAVKAGDVVEFDNTGNATHNVKFDDGTQSEDLTAGGKVLFKFATAGSFHYVCTFHPGMEGTITVS